MYRADRESERTCIVTRTKASPDAMIRFVLGPNAEVVPDLRRKLPGRGVWVTARRDTVEAALKAFARAFKAEVKVSASLPQEIETLLTERCLEALPLAKKAGQVVGGFFKVEAAIKSARVTALIHASDAGADGVRKLSQALRRGAGGERPEIKCFTSLQLSLALGSTNVVHAALTEGAASAAFLAHCRRLEWYRSGRPAFSVAGTSEAADRP